jgi:5-methylcytosine-specific restriction enzyme subunit McrC
LANTSEPRNEADSEYASAVEIAGIIINERSADIDRRGDDLDLTAVVVNFDILFEEYTRNILKASQHRRALDAVVLDGNKTGRKNLFDGTTFPKAQPDVVIKGNDGEPLLVVEVKYKSVPDRSDINQAITYAASYRVDNVAIVYQAAVPADAGLIRIGSIGNITLYRYGIQLDSGNIEEEEIKLASSMFSLANIS